MDQGPEHRNTGRAVRLRAPGPADSGIRPDAGNVLVVTDEQTGEALGEVTLDRGAHDPQTAAATFSVRPAARRRGVATAALRALGRHAAASGVHRLELVIPWENTAAQRAALAAGFAREGARRGALPAADGRQDALVFARLIGDPEVAPVRLLPDLPGGELSDGVVTLRPLGPGDLDFYTELHHLPDVVATSVPPVPMPDATIRERCHRAEAHWLAGSRADLVILDAATGAPAGEIGLYYQEPATAQAMIGYSMLTAYRGKGFTTRAAQLVALWAFAETGIARLIAGAVPENIGSQRVLEKAGFQREAYQRSRLPGPGGSRVDDIQFVLLAGDLLAQASGRA
ncbi:GNAT family N-acetyltransferase [Actinoplanes sp. NBRC 101535]|uniref:GNAT family N-acetyltransferase n=1 Tax=Actinoplanes sp. NBRC 101535 TaxID=3032196 RepID=UPI0024A008EB|nr:GNAT family N-acetyltransferase [Actinoplanes sp. NBRC 101535]GLY01180.1 hypothetical protein Acsp01_15590 [Actinoplanes sp. NBRC 101535]